MYYRTLRQQISDDRRRPETKESTLAEDLSDSISHEKTQFAAFGASILFLSSSYIITYLNCKAAVLLFRPRRPAFFLKIYFQSAL